MTTPCNFEHSRVPNCREVLINIQRVGFRVYIRLASPAAYLFGLWGLLSSSGGKKIVAVFPCMGESAVVGPTATA